MSPRSRWILLLVLPLLCICLPAAAGPDAGATDAAAAVCGDTKCEAGKEYCDTCPKDCGTCTGCQARSKAKCPSCACEACVCTLDNYCCSKQWDSLCAGQCKNACSGCTLLDGSMQIDGLVDAAPDGSVPPACGDGKCNPANETCDTCPKDCGKCNGCKSQNSSGCPGCACETCVCKKDAYCCSVQWDSTCAGLCKGCGGCTVSDLGLPDTGPDLVITPAKCGDGKCDPIDEYCDSCPKDCGKCNGCSMRLNKNCSGCACETCVCKDDVYCCDSQWDGYCAMGCKARCTCGHTDGGIYDLPPPIDLQLIGENWQGVKCGDGKCDALQEHCDTCPQDCGKCTGCQLRSTKNCPGCKCEACVCKMDPDCCKFQWDSLCVSECKTKCGGCGATDGGVDFAKLDLNPDVIKPADSKVTLDKAQPADAKPGDVVVDVKLADSKPTDQKKGEATVDLPPTPPDLARDGPPTDQPTPAPDTAADRFVPDDVTIVDAGKKTDPGTGGWECGCATTTPDASGLPLLLLPLLWLVKRRRRM